DPICIEPYLWHARDFIWPASSCQGTRPIAAESGGLWPSGPALAYERGMAFFQDPPSLGNTFTDDPLLQDYLARQLTAEHRAEITEELTHLGELAGGPLYRLQQEDRLNEPRLTHWDPWGHRIDRIEVSPL